LRCCPALLASDLTSSYADSVEDKRVVAVNDKPFAGVRELIHRLDLALENNSSIRLTLEDQTVVAVSCFDHRQKMPELLKIYGLPSYKRLN